MTLRRSVGDRVPGGDGAKDRTRNVVVVVVFVVVTAVVVVVDDEILEECPPPLEGVVMVVILLLPRYLSLSVRPARVEGYVDGEQSTVAVL